MEQHFCPIHKTRFFRNQKVDPTGQLSIWYSHKKEAGGFCLEQSPQMMIKQPMHLKAVDEISTSQKMYACNGKIPVEQIGTHFKKLFGELNAVA